MKIPSIHLPALCPIRHFLTTLVLCTFALAPGLRADGVDQEQLEVKANLVPTADAPAGASGKAELEAKDKDGTATAVLKIETQGLVPATYTVNVVLKSDTSTVLLGDLVVTGSAAVTGTDSSDSEDVNDDHGNHHGNHHGDQSDDAENEQGVVFGGSGLPFPDGFDPFDIGTVSVVDASAVVMLNGDLTSGIQNAKRQVVLSVIPGVAAPALQGKLHITAKSKNGVEKAVISLFARKAPANLSYNVNVNGVQIGQGVTSTRGEIRLGQTPGKHKGFAGFGQDVSGLGLQSLILTTGTGDEILSVIP